MFCNITQRLHPEAALETLIKKEWVDVCLVQRGCRGP